jgi:hypothetical protein
MFNLSLEDKRILRDVLEEYKIAPPKYFTQKSLSSIDWTLFKEHNMTIMELLQMTKNNDLALQIEKEILRNDHIELGNCEYLFEWNRNIRLIID